ncbi:MAG: glycosyltransferase family 39 protein [Deltaproteobacteria bacterium]|nr:glycosyltransferase family 39 protein [Deltaproteobacteria bacterium]MBW2540484.1 glycosyltransferase family 39 protein [Deltaproteobacteria bacterium]
MTSVPLTWSRGEKLAAGALFALALTLRLLHLREIELNDPFFALPSTDALLYHQWASEIARGDWLGQGVFFLAPLYAYFLGLVYAVFGSAFEVAMIANALLGALSSVLVVAVGRRLFDRRAALIAGALIALDSTSIFFGGMLASANLVVPLVLLLLLAAQRAHESPSGVRWLGAGFALGLCALAWQALLLFALYLVVWPVFSEKSSAASRARWAALVVAGMALAILPVSLRNYAVADEFALVNTGGGISLYVGNHPHAMGTYGMPRVYSRVIADEPIEQRQLFAEVAGQVSGRALKASEISAFWAGETLDYISTNPAQWLRHEVRKFGLFWNAAELWRERSPTAERAFSWVQRLPLISFALVGPLALLGMGLFASQLSRLYLVYAVIEFHLVVSLAFSVLARDRMSALPAFYLFASAAACWLWDRFRGRRFRALAIGLAALGLAAWLVHLPLSRENLAMAYYRLGDRFVQLEQWDEAIEYFGRSLNRDPGAISTWNQLALAFEARGDSHRDAVHTWLRVLDLARQKDYHLHAVRAERHLRGLGIEPLVAPPGAH